MITWNTKDVTPPENKLLIIAFINNLPLFGYYKKKKRFFTRREYFVFIDAECDDELNENLITHWAFYNQP